MHPLPPEVLLQIGLYLDAKTSLTWATKPFSKHKQWIRDLNMDDVAILDAALKANLTDLQSLTVGYLGTSLLYKTDEECELDQEPLVSSSSIPSEWETLVPRSAFCSCGRNIWVLDRIHAIWAFVLSNPGLHRLAFDSLTFPDTFTTTATTTPRPLRHIYCLTPARESFLVSTLSTLTTIRHLDIECADDYLLINMGTLLPTLESFVHSGQAGFDYGTLASSAPHSNLRSLAITKGSISHLQLHSIAMMSPALRDLSVYRSNIEWAPNTPRLPTLEHGSLHTLSIRETYDFAAIYIARVRFPNVRTLIIQAGRVEKSTSMFQHLSAVFPRLDCLEARGVFWGKKKMVNAHAPPAQIYPLTRLLLCGRGQEHFSVHALVLQMPFLVRQEVELISSTGLNAISSTCSNTLVYLRFSLRNWSAQVCQLLATCTGLKEFRGDGHVVLAEDIINGPAWTCMGLEKLDIVIRVPFKTSLDHLQCLDRARIKTRVTRRSAAEKAAKDQQEASIAMQQRVHAELARLGNLVEINFGWSYTYNYARYCGNKWAIRAAEEVYRNDIEAGIDFSQESGFGQVVSLPNLKKIRFHKFCTTQAIGSSQQAWMMEGWKMCETWKEYVYTLMAYRRA
ncbi:hypothetical protein K457DRAFT_21383 [Linnemannia elongata AG-77]|uniref:Uncharacterized protein n=1 Tax=Linnemannia elongata AG-77 TaxID=1314771 RepID=A0A197JPS0_9FUNG|nr:hypothetical protein K457DRAFT_21383 [Linnemannia elongata AG-77]